MVSYTIALKANQLAENFLTYAAEADASSKASETDHEHFSPKAAQCFALADALNVIAREEKFPPEQVSEAAKLILNTSAFDLTYDYKLDEQYKAFLYQNEDMLKALATPNQGQNQSPGLSR